jgi:hypothetical protein
MQGPPLNPYAPPAANVESEGARAPSTRTYRPLFGLATAVTVALAFSVLIEAVVIPHALTTISVMNQVEAGEHVTRQVITDIDGRTALLAIAQMIALLGGAIAFCMLTHRASCNAESYGQLIMRYTPGWAVGWYFIPIASLWKPYDAMKQIWQASDPTGDPHPGAIDVPVLLPAWWWAFVVHILAGQVSFRLTKAVHDPGGLIAACYADIVAAIATIIAAVLAILVVRSLAARQDACQKAAEAFRAARSAAPVASPY